MSKVYEEEEKNMYINAKNVEKKEVKKQVAHWNIKISEFRREKMKGIVFKYSPSRSEKTAQEFLKGYKGIPLTNSLAERSIRPSAVHRKNWLFADSVEGANANR